MLPKIFVLSSISTHIFERKFDMLNTNMEVDETIAARVIDEVCSALTEQSPPSLYGKLAILGKHGAGKDTVARQLAGITGLRFKYSLSHTFLGPIYTALARHLPLIERFETFVECRHNYAGYLNRTYTAIRRVDPFALLRKAVGDNDILVGVRSAVELAALQSYNVPLIYVIRDVPEDPTMEYKLPKFIDNNGSLVDLMVNVSKLRIE